MRSLMWGVRHPGVLPTAPRTPTHRSVGAAWAARPVRRVLTALIESLACTRICGLVADGVSITAVLGPLTGCRRRFSMVCGGMAGGLSGPGHAQQRSLL